MERNGETWYYIYDGHGSVRHLADSNGSLTDSYTYDAYGTLLEKEGITENDFLYAGEQYNAGTGLYYLRARYMDPSTGTFISMDSYQGSIYDPVSLHKYLYANANPVTYVDPSGYNSNTLVAQMITINIKCNLISSAYRTVLGSLVGMAAGGVIGAVDSWAGGNELHQIVDDAFKGALTGFFCGGVMSAFANFAWFLPELEVALKIQPIAGVILGYFGIKDSLDNGHGKQAVIRTLLTLPSIIGSAAVLKDVKLPKFGSKSGSESIDYTYDPKKIGKQMEKRGWTEEAIQETLDNPVRTVETRDTRWLPGADGPLDDPATAYYASDGSYVVRNDKTGVITQISNKNDPNWIAPWDVQD